MSVYQSTFKYAYLLIFFALLSGLFQPLVAGEDGDMLVAGTMILLLGLLGGVLLWKAAYDKNNRIPIMGMGFGLLGASLYMMHLV